MDSGESRFSADEVIRKLKLGDQLVAPDIASRIYEKMLPLVEPEIPTIRDWVSMEKKLKWVLRSQAEILFRVATCQQLLDGLLKVKRGAVIAKQIEDLAYEYNFLSQDLLLLITDVEYPSWNFLNFIDPDYWFKLQMLTPSLVEKFEKTVRLRTSNSSNSLHELTVALTERQVDQSTLAGAINALSAWLQNAQRYEQLLTGLYEAEDLVEIFYGLYYSFASAVELLASSLIIKVTLKPLINQLGDRWVPTIAV
jgi:hypothetical protein